MRYLPLFVVSVLLFACDGASRDRRAARGEDYVSDPSHLYFKNIRSKDYVAVTLEEGVEAYRHDELIAAEDLLIVDYWLEDRAELRRDGELLSLAQARGWRDSLRRQDRSAALQVVEDYLRLLE